MLRTASIVLGVAAAALFVPAAAVFSDEGSPAPLLEQISRETQTLYQRSKTGLVQLQVPPPKWLNDAADAENPVQRWENLDPKVKDALGKTAGTQVRTQREVAQNPATTQPASRLGQSKAEWKVRRLDKKTIVLNRTEGDGEALMLVGRDVEVDKDGGVLGGKITVKRANRRDFDPNQLGVLLDDEGHVLIPLYMTASDIANQKVKASAAGSSLTTAKYVGGDRKSGISILKLKDMAGKALRISAAPEEGAVVMLISPGARAARLTVWSPKAQEFGLVITPDGGAAGFARGGRFVALADLQTVAEQIIAHGKAERPVLGVRVSEMLTTLKGPEQAKAGKLMIVDVTAGSAAQRAGLRSGDIVQSIAGKKVDDIATFAAAVAKMKGRTPMAVIRDGKRFDVIVELTAE